MKIGRLIPCTANYTEAYWHSLLASRKQQHSFNKHSIKYSRYQTVYLKIQLTDWLLELQNKCVTWTKSKLKNPSSINRSASPVSWLFWHLQMIRAAGNCSVSINFTVRGWLFDHPLTFPAPLPTRRHFHFQTRNIKITQTDCHEIDLINPWPSSGARSLPF